MVQLSSVRGSRVGGVVCALLLGLVACPGEHGAPGDAAPNGEDRPRDIGQGRERTVTPDGTSRDQPARDGRLDGGGTTDGPSAGSAFRFIAWADTKTATAVLTSLSTQAVTFKPVFTIYVGDMVDSWSDSNMNNWRTAMDGGKSNGLFDVTFTVRGNHEGSSSGYFNWMAKNHPLAQAAAKFGAKSFSNMVGRENEAYSFDHGNAHFVGLDSLGDADSIGADQVSWLDADLTAAEKRGLTHAFIYFHGPIYCVAEHCDCTQGICKSGIYNIVGVLNKHPLVSATFHGHEHVYAYTYLDSKRDAKITHPFHQFVTGDAGAGPDVCDSGRYDYWMKSHGFVVVDVDGAKVNVAFYKQGGTQPDKMITWTK